MVVITLTDCPSRLRGDLTKWMLEINTGVYVGNFSARVRNGLWKRVCENIKNGRAVMIYSTGGEQHFGFEVHNSRWVPEDYDGIQLIRHLSEEKQDSGNESLPELSQSPIRSKAAAIRAAKTKKANKFKYTDISHYIVLDIETTGLDVEADRIIEIGALRIENGNIIQEFNYLIFQTENLPAEIKELTEITDGMLKETGKSLKDILPELYDFIGDNVIVCHNSTFERSFLNAAFQSENLPELRNTYVDTLELARRKLRNVRDYKLKTLAEYLRIEHNVMHRALSDCRITFELFEKLKDF